MRLNGLLGLLHLADTFHLQNLAASAIIITLEDECISNKEKWFILTMQNPMFRSVSQVSIYNITNKLRDFDQGPSAHGLEDLQELGTFTAKEFLVDKS